MSLSFSISRFYHLTKEHAICTWKSAIILAVVLTGVLAMALVFFELNNGYSSLKYQITQEFVFNSLFVLTIVLTGLFWFNGIIQKEQKIKFLTLPVSAFERWLLCFIWCTILIPGFFLFIFQIVNKPIFLWAQSFELKAHFDPNGPYYRTPYQASSLIDLTSKTSISTVRFALLIQVALICGILWFRRSSLTKSIAAVAIVVILYLGYFYKIIPVLFTPKLLTYHNLTFFKITNSDFSEYLEIKASPFLISLESYHFIIVWIGIWILNYIRIKTLEA